jgi:hypothetical protein
MDFTKLRDLIPAQLRALWVRQSLTIRVKVNPGDLQTCVPKGVQRERPFWRADKLDWFHLLPDNSIKHTPGD